MSERTVYHLAALALVDEPDSEESPGGRWLRQVEEATLMHFEDDGDFEGLIHEIADASVPELEVPRWRVFLDLHVYTEDPFEEGLGSESMTMTELAGVCLYLVAERLIRAVAEAEGN